MFLGWGTPPWTSIDVELSQECQKNIMNLIRKVQLVACAATEIQREEFKKDVEKIDRSSSISILVPDALLFGSRTHLRWTLLQNEAGISYTRIRYRWGATSGIG